MAPKVKRHHVKSVRECRGKVVPPVCIGAPAVQQNERREVPIAPPQRVEAGAGFAHEEAFAARLHVVRRLTDRAARISGVGGTRKKVPL